MKPPRQQVIQGNFKPSTGVRQLRLLCVILGGLFVAGVCVSVALYGAVVRYETGINRVAKRTRQLSEDNRTLQARLNRLQSFQNVESAAAQAPTLRLPDEVLEVSALGVSAPILREISAEPHGTPKPYGY